MNDNSDNESRLVRAGLVPYIVRWSGERPVRTPVVTKGRSGIGYPNERPGDRDERGVLWSRYVHAPGEGVPEFGGVHPYRQRHAMRHLLCQVCGEPADRDDRGVLWLVGDAGRGWSDEDVTGHPPVCLRCAGTARRACPYLRSRGALALRVRNAPLAGVSGTLYEPRGRSLVCLGPATLAYDDPRVRYLKAAQLMRALRDWTVVDLDRQTT
ncbi:hypothetical protein [Actinoallomurus iriomotensis]|uniref:Uncharacterized protein n=1 Tax=Actinoallomurus iriomotensis TaxID=478107 RepID=A0A9W6W0C0_9ACTN|nr:hypothetical protein [Actinoallomurus iriomotensis]GLY85612.1 hypothetical protein Airi02_035410 [Actinoallomurus iriomotensis]